MACKVSNISTGGADNEVIVNKTSVSTSSSVNAGKKLYTATQWCTMILTGKPCFNINSIPDQYGANQEFNYNNGSFSLGQKAGAEMNMLTRNPKVMGGYLFFDLKPGEYMAYWDYGGHDFTYTILGK